MTAAGWLERWACWLVMAMFLGMADSASADNRVALVVGNSGYQHTTALANPLNDARDLAAALERTGFDVIVALDAGKAQIDGALRAFADKLGKADVALFFYAGHGLQVGQQNYLVPVDAQLQRERDLEFEAVKLDFVLRQMEIDREGKTTIVMLDACRDNPLARNLARTMGTRSTAIGQGLAPASTGVGTFIAYSTQPGNVALDGAGRNSPFTAALLGNIAKRGRNLNATMIEVRKEVIKSTGGRQVPWDHSALTGDFYFVPGQVAAGTTTPAPAAQSDDVEALKARLAALEAAQQKQASGSTQARAPGADPGMIHELRTRLVLAQEQAKELQMKLLEARRIEGQARDPAEKQRLLQASIKIQGDMTRASQTAKRLQEELAGLAPPGSPTPPPAAQPSASEGRTTFSVTSEHRAIGDEMPLFPSTANCESRCQSEPACVAYNLSRDGVCELLSGVTRTVAASNWRTGLREGQGAAQSAQSGSPRIEIAPTRSERGYGIYENATLSGDKIKVGAADSVAGCLNTCRNTPGCIAGDYNASTSPQISCSVYRRLQGVQGRPGGTTVFVKSEATRGATLPPVQARGSGKPAADFVLAEGVRLEGSSRRPFRTVSPAACQAVCSDDSTCAGFQHGRKIGVMGQCQLFSAVTARHEDQAWRSGVRATGTDAAKAP